MRFRMSMMYSGQQKFVHAQPARRHPRHRHQLTGRTLDPWRPFRRVPCLLASRTPGLVAVPLGSLDVAAGFGGVRGFCFGSGNVIFGGVDRGWRSFERSVGAVDGGAASMLRPANHLHAAVVRAGRSAEADAHHHARRLGRFGHEPGNQRKSAQRYHMRSKARYWRSSRDRQVLALAAAAGCR